MAVKIKNNKIEMTRGDTLRVLVGITVDENPYSPVVGEAVRFAVKNRTLKAGGKEYSDNDPLILKDIPIATMILELQPQDTKPLGFGMYCYDIQITFEDGTVSTFIEPDLDGSKKPIPNFILTPEVY